MMNTIDEASDYHYQQQKIGYGYERLVHNYADDDDEPAATGLFKSKSLKWLPVFGSTKRFSPEVVKPTTTTPTTLKKSQSARQAGQGYNKKLGKTHPLFNINSDVLTTTPATIPAKNILMKSQSVRQEGQGNNNSKKVGKSHPLFNFNFNSDSRRSKKAMSKPEFLRYMEYIKEGGTYRS